MGGTNLTRRLLAGVLIVDGVITAAWGRGFLRWQRRVAPDWYQPGLDALLDWPEWLLRLGAAGQALLAGILWAYWLKHEAEREEA